MTWYPIAFIPPQLSDSTGAPYVGAVLKAYAAETTTVIPMATSSSGSTTASSFVLNAAGYPVSGGNVIIPHIQEDYKLSLYPTQAAADANSGAVWTYDDINIAATTNTAFVQEFSGDNSTVAFTLSQDLGTDEKTVMIFVDRPFTEYSTNGTFASDTAWTKGANISIAAGVAAWASANSNDLYQTSAVNILAGEPIIVEYDVATASAGGVTVKIGGTSGTQRTTTGTFRELIIPAASDQLVKFSGGAFTGSIDNVKVHRAASAHREILRPEEYTLANTTLTFVTAPQTGTNNILVYAPSLLFGAVGAAAAAAATSETNAAASAALAAADVVLTHADVVLTHADVVLTHADVVTAAASAAAATAAAIGLANEWLFATSTTMADPSTGNFRLNNASFGSVTNIALSALSGDSGNPNLHGYIMTWDDSNNTPRGTIRIEKNATNFLILGVNGAITDNTTWVQIPVTVIASAGAFSASDITFLQFTQYGNNGTVTVTGSPVTGNLTKFTGAASISNVDLTGDVTTSGTVATTLATVNGNVGAFTAANITVDAKGRVTAAANGSASEVVLLDTQTAAASSVLTFTGTMDVTKYTRYWLELNDIVLSTSLKLRIEATVNGTTWATVLFYGQIATITLGGTTAPSYTAGANGAAPGDLTVANSDTYKGELNIYLGTATGIAIEGFIKATSSGLLWKTFQEGVGGGPVTGIRVSTSTGTMTTGDMKLYALKRT